MLCRDGKNSNTRPEFGPGANETPAMNLAVVKQASYETCPMLMGNALATKHDRYGSTLASTMYVCTFGSARTATTTASRYIPNPNPLT